MRDVGMLVRKVLVSPRDAVPGGGLVRVLMCGRRVTLHGTHGHVMVTVLRRMGLLLLVMLRFLRLDRLSQHVVVGWHIRRSDFWSV